MAELTFQTEDNSLTEIEIPSFLDFDSDIVESIENIQCYIDDKKHNHERIEQTIQISHKPNDKIKIEYTLTLKDEFFNETQVLYFFGDRFFLIPKITPNTNVTVTLKWKDIPCDWKAISSFGIGKNKSLQDLFSSFHKAFFLLVT